MILNPQRNMPGVILLVASVVLAAGGAGLPLLLSPDRQAGPAADELPAIPAAPDTLEAPKPGADVASSILDNPIFFSNRQLPVVEEVAGVEEDEDQPVAVSKLNATISGVIVTPESRLVMIKVPGAKRPLILKEGMSLDGELAAWKVGEIQSRGVTFAAADGQTEELELEVRGKALSTPAPSSRPRSTRTAQQQQNLNNRPKDASQADQKERQASLAEEVRRRIAERRAQLRAQRQQQNQNEEDDE